MTEETIFATALEKKPGERTAYLAKVCGGDTALRQRLEGLLAASEKVGKFMARPVVAGDFPNSATEILDDGSAPNDAAVTLDGPSHSDEDHAEAVSFLSPSIRPDSLGRIGHYEVLQVLGKGGFGIVFRAFDDILQRVVAVKVMAPQLAATSPARKRFLREARTSAAVRHENVVQVYEVAEQPLPYLVMEFIPGETLQQRLDRTGPLETAEVVRIGRQIAEGLAAAHGTDLIHRDIKPANVLLEGGQQKVKITDFGLARAADDASISQSGIIAGTPMYMAPEQAQGQTLDQRADLFSLGSVLYQMAAGRAPFRANSTVAVLKRVAEDTPRAIREIIPETPQWLCDIISKLHAKNPDERYQSAREVADVLADCEAQLKANSKLKDFSRIPRGKAQPSGRRKWVAAAVLILPILALAMAESAGVTHLFRGRQVAHDPIKPGGDPTPDVVAKQETPPQHSAKRTAGLKLTLQSREASTGALSAEPVELASGRVAVVVVDVWTQHSCKGFAQSPTRMIQDRNEFLDAARTLDIPVVFACAQDDLSRWDGKPQRTGMTSLPHHPLPPSNGFMAGHRGNGPWPADCMCSITRVNPNGSPVYDCNRQAFDFRMDPRITVRDEDLFIDARADVPSAVTSWGQPAQQELWNFIQERKITHLLYLGDATNMCVINREYGMIQMRRLGVKTVIVRDLTNAMTFDGYNPDTRKLDPAVTPAVGTAKAVEYIEKMIGPSLDGQQIKDIARRVAAEKNASGKTGVESHTKKPLPPTFKMPEQTPVSNVPLLLGVESYRKMTQRLVVGMLFAIPVVVFLIVYKFG